MSIRFVDVPSSQLGPYVEGLRALERDIAYPIDDGRDAFRIDHGPDYHPFFSTLGEAVFVLALDGDRVVGTIVGMLREASARGTTIPTLYLADQKVDKAYRGQRLPQRMHLFSLKRLWQNGAFGSWRYAYVAAMRGAKGDVMRTVRGLHFGKLVRPAAELGVYFVAPSKLASLPIDGAPPPPDDLDGLDLSPQRASLLEPPGMTSTAGRKDLYLRSTGKPWPLAHLPLGPSGWGASHAAYLRACGEALVAKGAPGPACFAVDLRLAAPIAWLDRHGIARGAVATVYSFSLSYRARAAEWVHMATSEI